MAPRQGFDPRPLGSKPSALPLRYRGEFFGARGGLRSRTPFQAAAFEAAMSTDSITRAYILMFPSSDELLRSSPL